MKASSNVLVVVINYRTSHLMKDLVASIVEDDVAVSILIVDNASTPETFSELQFLDDTRVQLLRSEQNLGFTGGINYALKYAQRQLPDINYFFLLNPDAFSRPNLITSLVHILQTNPKAACVSPQIVYMNDEPWYSGALINFSKGQVLNIPDRKMEHESEYYEVDVFSGCAVLFDMQKVIKAGMFNETLFMYYDEADFSIKLKSLGYQILYTPKFKIYHDVSYTTRSISHLKTYYMTRNKFIVFNQSMSLFHKVYFVFFELAFHLKNRRIKNAVYHLKGLYDFVRKRRGPYSMT